MRDLHSTGQRTDGIFTGVGPDSSTERPFDRLFNGFVEKVREEGNNGETELMHVSIHVNGV